MFVMLKINVNVNAATSQPDRDDVSVIETNEKIPVVGTKELAYVGATSGLLSMKPWSTSACQSWQSTSACQSVTADSAGPVTTDVLLLHLSSQAWFIQHFTDCVSIL